MQTNEPIGPRAVDFYNELNQTILDLIKDPAKEKSFQGRSYKTQDLALLKKMRDEFRKEAELRGEIAVDLRSAHVGVAQAMVVDVRGYIR